MFIFKANFCLNIIDNEQMHNLSNLCFITNKLSLALFSFLISCDKSTLTNKTALLNRTKSRSIVDFPFYKMFDPP